MSKIITRQEAKSLGLQTYPTGVPCKHGHISERYAISGVCVSFRAAASKKWGIENREKLLEINAAWKASNKERIAETNRAWRDENKDRSKLVSASWYAANKERKLEKAKIYAAANREKISAYRIAWGKTNAVRIKAVNDIWRANNAEKMTATTIAWRKDHPEKIREYAAAWAERNPEKETARWAAKYAKDPEASKKKCAEWRKNNPGKTRVYMQNYKALKDASGEKLSVGLADKLFKLQGGKCPCCGLPLGENYHMDHIIPLKLGGPNNDGNIQLLRQRCNNQKNAKHPIDFMQSLGFLL